MKKLFLILLSAMVIFAFSACGTTPSSSSQPSSDESNQSSSEDAAGDDATSEYEISLETFFNGSSADKATGVYAYVLWYSDHIEYKLSEYTTDINNVAYYQEGTAEFTLNENQNEVIIIERSNMLEGAQPNEADKGTIEMTLIGNELTYKVIRGEAEEIYTLAIATEAEIEELKKA